jgi:tetratricopeptide (TPR) repeat protein
MTPERYARVCAVAERLWGLDAGARPRALEDACGDDTGLRAAVEAFLGHDDAAGAGGFLDRPNDTPALSGGPAELGIGARLGPYELRERIGAGGMGTVFRAERVADFAQTVAVKVLRPALLGADRVARFEGERAILAGLEHPNVVRLLDGGRSADGQPYLVMEHVAGLPLDEAVERHRLDLRQRAALLEQAARAVEFAHRRGVVHRDLKPGNLLVAPAPDGAGWALKVADFGLARQADDAAPRLTQTGAIVGTPAYMAPEQAAGSPVGPAADVYALGAVLYELLTGRPPFAGPDLLAVLHQAQAEPPLPPRRLTPGLPRDLETICLKCLEKAPARRYASAADLADDLRRWLDGEPIRARPVGALGRAARWARRRPLAAGLLAALAAALTTILVGGAVFLERLERERTAAVRAEREKSAALEQVEQERTAAVRAEREKSAALGRAESRLEVFRQLVQRYRRADRGVAKLIPREAVEQLRAAATACEQLTEREPDNPDLWEELGMCWYILNRHDGAEESFRKARSAMRRAIELREPAAGPGERRDLSRSCRQLGDLLAARYSGGSLPGGADEAEALLRRAVALLEGEEGAVELALARAQLARFLCHFRQRPDEVIRLADQAIAGLKAELARPRPHGLARSKLSDTWSVRALALERKGRWAEAVVDWGRALEDLTLPAPMRRAYRFHLHEAQARAGDYRAAAAGLEKLEKLPGLDGEWWADLATPWAVAARAARAAGDGAQAEHCAGRAESCLLRALQKGHRLRAAALRKDADLAVLRGRDRFERLLRALGPDGEEKK